MTTQAKQDTVPRTWLTIEEAADRAGCSVDTLMRAYVRGELRVTALGRGIRSPKRFRPEWVDAWLESLAKGGTEQAS